MIRTYLTDFIGALCVFPGIPYACLLIAHGLGWT